MVVNGHDVDLKECAKFSQPGMRVELLGEYKYIRVYFDMGLTLLWNRGKMKQFTIDSL